MDAPTPQPSDRVETGPVLEHIAFLRADGMGVNRIADTAGLDRRVLATLLHGNHGAPRYTMREKVARTILAVQPVPSNWSHVPGIGSTRRLQALMCNGWSISQLSERSGVAYCSIRQLIHANPVTTHQTAESVRRLFGEIWFTPPPAMTGEDRRRVAAAQAMARRNKWVHAMLWEEDEIDDPEATPCPEVGEDFLDELAIERCVRGDDRVELTNGERREVVRILTERGMRPVAIEKLTGIQDRQIRRDREALARAG